MARPKGGASGRRAAALCWDSTPRVGTTHPGADVDRETRDDSRCRIDQDSATTSPGAVSMRSTTTQRLPEGRSSPTNSAEEPKKKDGPRSVLDEQPKTLSARLAITRLNDRIVQRGSAYAVPPRRKRLDGNSSSEVICLWRQAGERNATPPPSRPRRKDHIRRPQRCQVLADTFSLARGHIRLLSRSGEFSTAKFVFCESRLSGCVATGW